MTESASLSLASSCRSSASPPWMTSFSSATSAMSFFGRRLVLGRLGLADLFRRRVAPRLRLLQPRHDLAPLLVERDQRLRLRRKPALFQPGVESLGVVSDPLDVEHGRWASSQSMECWRCYRAALGGKSSGYVVPEDACAAACCLSTRCTAQIDTS